MDNKEQKPTPRKRTRTKKGTFQEGKETNQHVEATELENAVGEKEVDYKVKKKVDGTSKPTAGKYLKKDGIRPAFGTVRTKLN